MSMPFLRSGDLLNMVRAGLRHGLGTLLVKAVRVVQELLVAWTFAIESSVDGWLAAYALACIPINLALHAYQPPLVAALARDREGELGPTRLGARSIAQGLMGAALIGILAPAWFRLACPEPAAEAAGKSALPFLVVAVIAGIISVTWNGVLQAFERYFLAGVLPVFVPLVMAGTLMMAPPEQGILPLAFGYAAGAVVEAAVSWWAARNLPQEPNRNADVPDGARSLSGILDGSMELLPGVICASLVPLVDQYFASHAGGAGAIATLGYAQRLPHFLAGTLSLAVSAAGTTRLARASASDNGRVVLLRGGAGVLFVGSLAVAAPLAVMAKPVTGFLFRRGVFDEADVAAVAAPSAFLLIGLPFLLVRIFAMRGLTVAGRNREAAAIQASHLVLVIVLNLVFSTTGMGLVGVAAASTIAAGFGAWLAWLRAR